MKHALRLLAVGALAALFTCNPVRTPVCGDHVVDPGEACDGDAGCGADCRFTCGNGVVDGALGETCDLGIQGDGGACPTSCDDGVACTTDALAAAGSCQAACSHEIISAAIAGDGCCPAGADSTVDADCATACGNGVLEQGEACDTGITSGPGTCPLSCDDGMVCTTDSVTSEGTCQASCAFVPVTVPTNGDGCCPSGANSLNDDDCTASCGNGVLESGELCDTGIVAGAGSCPMSCDDGLSCTADTLMNDGSCQAACGSVAITVAANGDGCCLAGDDAIADDDCPAVCGNGVLEPGEECDTSSDAGCPTSCDDGLLCTTDALLDGGTCQARCDFAPITQPVNGDACCPLGADAGNDSDCVVVCGDGILQPGEQCDDHNVTNGDGCSSLCTIELTVFRFTDLDLRDPHVVVNFSGCSDMTDVQVAGFSVNSNLQTAIQTDGDSDGLLDLSPTFVMRPLRQADGASSTLDFRYADCDVPMASTTCQPGASPAVRLPVTAQASAACLRSLPGTTHGYAPPIVATPSPCFSTDAGMITLPVLGTFVPMHDARIAATFVGAPASSTINGLIMGFVTQADADQAIIPAVYPLVGGQALSSLLPGGQGNCSSSSDVDTVDGGAGWWFYLNFTAEQVTGFGF